MAFKLFQSNSKNALERRFSSFSDQLTTVFGKIKNDIQEAHMKADSHDKDLKRLQEWINYLHSQNMALYKQNEDLMSKYEKVSEKSLELHDLNHQISSKVENAHKYLQESKDHIKHHKSEVSELLDTHKAELKKALTSQEQLTKEEIDRLKAWVNYFMAIGDKQKSRETELQAELAAIRNSFSQVHKTSESTINTLKTDNFTLKQHLDTVSKELQQVQTAISQTKSELENTKNSVVFLSKKQESESSKQVQQPVASFQQPQINQVAPEYLPPIQHSPFERHIINRVMPNRKGYILNFILETISEGKLSTKEVEEIVVKEKQLCGRTSFYAYLKELKYRGKLGYATIDERSTLVNLVHKPSDN